MIDVLAETLQKLSARRGLLAREISTLDEAIAALQRVRDEAPKHGTAAARPGPVSVPPSKSPGPIVPSPPRHCARKSCGKPLPPPVRYGGRPRIYCNPNCAHRAADQRRDEPVAPVVTKPASPRPAPPADDDGEDPTDRALRRHRELHPVPESSSGMRSRAKGRT